MAQTVVQNNGSSNNQFASGHISGTYTAADFTITLGFTPRYFRIINLTDRVTNEWFEGMAQGDYFKTASNGDRTLETDDSIVISAGSGNSSGGAGTLGTGSGSGAQTIGDNTSTQIPGTKAAAPQVTVDISVSGIMTDNDEVVWQAFG